MTELDPEVIELRRAAQRLIVNADDRGETSDEDGVEFKDWKRLRKAIDAVRALEKST